MNVAVLSHIYNWHLLSMLASLVNKGVNVEAKLSNN